MIAAALVAALACPGPPALVQDRQVVVACEDRQRVVVRRAPPGTEITDVAGAGRRVAWGERGIIRVSRVARGRIVPLHRRRVARPSAELEVVLTTRGELAWLTRGRVYATKRLHGPARLVAREAGYGLRLEDDRTLRWWTYDYGTFGYADLRPWPGRGCPRRSRFRRVAESPEVIATSSYWSNSYFESVTVIRACVRATGADPVIAQAWSSAAGGYQLAVAAVRGPWVVLSRDSWFRYDACTPAYVEVVDAVEGGEGRGGTFPCGLTPTKDSPLVVTDGGAPAWIVPTQQGSVLLTTAGKGGVELDSAGPDGLTDLVAEGGTVRWRHDGEPRSAVLD